MNENIFADSTPSDEEYAACIGNNVHFYLPKFRRYALNPTNFHGGWNWPAFFFGCWWFLYRKMYFWALIAFITLCIPYFQLLFMIGWGVVANYLYFRHVNSRMDELRGVQGRAFMQCLYESGGVHGWVPWVAFFVSGGFVLMVLLGVVSLALLI